jgi:hypothetical protein
LRQHPENGDGENGGGFHGGTSAGTGDGAGKGDFSELVGLGQMD